MKKKILIIVIIVLIIAGIGGYFYYKKNQNKPEDTLKEYVSKINEEKYNEILNELVEKYGAADNYKYRGISLKSRDDLLMEEAANDVTEFSTAPTVPTLNQTVNINNTEYTVNNVYN